MFVLWTEQGKLESTTVRELPTIYFALQLHAENVRDTVIRLYSDNMTALKYVQNEGDPASPLLQQFALKINEILLRYKIRPASWKSRRFVRQDTSFINFGA